MGWSRRPKHRQRSCETSAGPPLPLFLRLLGERRQQGGGKVAALGALSGPGDSDPNLGTARRPGYPVPVPVPQSLASRIHSPNILFQLRMLPYALSNRPEDPPKAPVNSP